MIRPLLLDLISVGTGFVCIRTAFGASISVLQLVLFLLQILRRREINEYQ